MPKSHSRKWFFFISLSFISSSIRLFASTFPHFPTAKRSSTKHGLIRGHGVFFIFARRGLWTDLCWWGNVSCFKLFFCFGVCEVFLDFFFWGGRGAAIPFFINAKKNFIRLFLKRKKRKIFLESMREKIDKRVKSLSEGTARHSVYQRRHTQSP